MRAARAILFALLLPPSFLTGAAFAQANNPAVPLERRDVLLPLPTPDKVPVAATWSLVERSAKSVPLGAASVAGAPKGSNVDLARLGYVEEEYLVSGKGRYTTRILVRRPSDPYRFSGTVQIEALSAGNERARIWDMAWPYLADAGDVWVGLTVSPASVEALKTFDAQRYGKLDIARDELRFDILAETAWMLRQPGGGLVATLAFDEKSDTIRGLLRLHAVGMDGAGCFLADMLAHGHHDRARRPDGRGVIDGYLIGSCVSGEKLQAPKDLIPVMQLVTETEFLKGPDAVKKLLAMRQPDLNLPAGRYRWYEVAGTSRQSRADLFSTVAYQTGRAAAAPNCPEVPERSSALATFVRAALFSLDRWPRLGAHAPPGAQFQLDGEAIQRDEHGNAMGGVRSPWLDVPVSTYLASAETQPDDACGSLGRDVPFPRAKLATLYKDRADYVGKVQDNLIRLVNTFYLNGSDADAVLKEIGAASIP